jgi:NodT family efflux transporter outer membrane factor (OMF) lipoprotein
VLIHQEMPSMSALPRFSLISAIVAATLAGCSVGPAFQAPDDLLAKAELHPRGAGTQSEVFSSTAVPVDWWALFDDPLLTALETEVAGSSLDLLAAASRVEESRALLGIAAARQLPQVGLAAGEERAALSKNSPLATLGMPTTPYEQWVVGFQASWEIDLWGYLRHLSESSAAQFDASRYDLASVRVSIAAEVAAAYFRVRGTQAQLKLGEERLQIARDALRLSESRERNGVATRFDSANARSELARQQARVQALRHQREVQLNALALLLAKPPRVVDERFAESTALPDVPARLPVGVSSELAHRRPDILRAEARLRAAIADIGAAHADFYPRIRLTGSAGAMALTGRDLGSWDARQFSFGPTLYLPIFEGGRLRQTLALTQAKHRSAGIAYRQVVLAAWHEIDNALRACVSERERQRQLDIAVAQSQLASMVSQRNFAQGAADRLDVLAGERVVNENRSAQAESATLASLTVVALYKALGGGWSPQSLRQDGFLETTATASADPHRE